MDYYSILGVGRDAAPDEIKKAYRKLASRHHPDKGGDKAKFQEIQVAYDTLIDPEKRQQYDNPSPHGFHFDVNTDNMHDVFGDVFRQFGFNPFHQGSRRAPRNRDTRIEIVIDLADTLVDQHKIIKLTSSNAQDPIDVKIPRGVNPGTTIKYEGLGDQSHPNMPRGDLLVVVQVRSHPDFQVHGLDLFKTLTIDSFDAILGCEREITTLDNRTFNVKIPAGCQPGTKLKISGEGLYAMRTDIRGHLYIQISVKTPTDLTEHQLHLIRSAQEWQP